MRLNAVSTFLIVGLLGFQELRASSPDLMMAAESSLISGKAMIDNLRPVLRAAGKVARIYFAGKCQKVGDLEGVLFPPIHVQAPLQSTTGLAAVRDIFRDEAGVSVADEAHDGIIRIVIGKVPLTILDTPIPVLTFGPSQQYTDTLAIWRITDSKEVIAAEKKLGLHIAGPPMRISLGMDPAEGLPHLPASMTNVTVDQALDTVAKTFGGIVVYGTCPDLNSYVVYFVQVEPQGRAPGTPAKP
jgi:hypothetical protein